MGKPIVSPWPKVLGFWRQDFSLNFRSTFSQIIWLQVLAIATTSLVMPLALFVFLDRTVSDYQMRMLDQHEKALMGALSPKPGGGVSIRPDARLPYSPGRGGFAFVVLDRSGASLASSQPGAAPLAPLAPAKPGVVTFRRRIGAASYYGATFPETVGGRRVWVQVGQNLEDPDVVIDDILARFLPMVGWLSGSLLLLLLIADIVIVRRALRPVLRASQLAQAITPRSMDVRLPTKDMPREIAPLILAVNQALERLEDGFRSQRDLTADVAHELRTPLAVMRMRSEALTDAAVRSALHADIDVMTRVVGQLLDLAELDVSVADPEERADLRRVCLEAAEHLAPLAVGEGKQIELTGADGPVMVRGQDGFLFQAVRNLLENAVAHAPQGSVVEIEVRPQGEVRVLDRGPGVPVDERQMLFRRFWRQRRGEASAAGAGAGLGLSIVARVAERHGGKVWVEDRPGGGAMFVLQLSPAAKPAA